MAQEGSEASVASTSTNPNWWHIHANAISSWNSWQQQQQLRNPNSSSCDEDISISATSFTNASNQSGVSVGSSSAANDLTGEPTISENHLWSQFLSTGCGGDDHLNKNLGNHEEIFHETMSSKNLTPEMFGPACDYLKKLDESWEFLPPTPFTTSEKQLNTCNPKLIDHERPTNLSDLVSNWSIAPPQQQFDHQIGLQPDLSQIKPEIPNNSSSYNSTYGISGATGDNSSEFFLTNTSYGNEIKGECQQQDQFGGQQPSFLRPICVNGLGLNRVGLWNSTSGIVERCLVSDGFGSNKRNFSDLINFGESVHKQQLLDRRIPKPSSSVRELDKEGKQGHEVASITAKANLKGTGSPNEGKKKRSEDTSDAVLKKSKHEGSNTSSAKLQIPKVKLGEKITALQQIVSPFGKTDTASVLLEAINYIRFLHEQVQLLSDPYMKSGLNKKDLYSWGGMERKDKQEIKLDLSSKGLCLVPVSCTPQIYRENTGTDYWTPAYRGCLYR